MPKSRDPIFAPERKKHKGLATLLLLLVLAAALIVCFNIINNSRVNLEKTSITIPTLPRQAENFRILHITDLHGLYFGKDQQRIADALKGQPFDIVCFTGDAVDKDGHYDAFLALIDLFPGKPFYFIPGDEDPSAILATPHAGDSPKAAYVQAAEEKGAVLLDAPVRLVEGSTSVWLSPEWVYSVDAGTTARTLEARRKELMEEVDSPEKKAALEAVAYQEERLERIRQARKAMLPADTHIALAHHPMTATSMETLVEFLKTDNESYVSTISLILAGHYAGGQWRLPLVGAVKVPPTAELGKNGWFPDDTYVTGLSYQLGIAQFVSSGLGTSAENGLPGIRLFNTPTLSLITLTTKMIY